MNSNFARRYGAIFVCAAFLTACAGQPSATAVPTTVSPSGPAHAKRTAVKAQLTIKIPRKKSKRRGARYISPATKSIAIAIYDASHSTLQTTANQNITTGSPGCTTPTPISPLTCQITFSVPPGSYAADFVTYDQVLQGNGDPQGAELSANVDFPFTVTAGATNDVSVTLGGIPAGLIVTPVTPGYLRGDAHALRLWGPTGQSVFVAAVDADESAIIGTGAPQLTVTSGSSTLGVTTTTAPNVFTLAASTTGSPAVVTPGKVFLSVAASPLSSTGVGGSVTASVPVTIQHSAVYVSILTPNVVDIFYDGNIGTPTVLSAGVPVRGLALDTNGTLYVADNSNNGVSEYRAGTTTQIASLSGSGMSTPYALSLDTNGTLYVANYGGNSVTEYVRDSTTATTTLNDASISGPYGITVDTAGTVYLANFGGNTVTEYTGGATTPGVTLNSASGINGPHGVAVDANGTLYVANFTGNSLAEFAAGSTVATFPVTSGLSGPYGVSVDAAGTLYVVNETTKSVNEYLHGQGAPVVTIPTGDLTGTPLFVAAYPGAIVP